MYPLSEGMFAPRKQWYIAAWSTEIQRSPMERWILNEPVAFYRKEDGTSERAALWVMRLNAAITE
jgi:phenylpropionate dioxygenase-like ring-hydroxylating dioxygenase large terminal subunit